MVRPICGRMSAPRPMTVGSRLMTAAVFARYGSEVGGIREFEAAIWPFYLVYRFETGSAVVILNDCCVSKVNISEAIIGFRGKNRSKTD